VSNAGPSGAAAASQSQEFSLKFLQLSAAARTRVSSRYSEGGGKSFGKRKLLCFVGGFGLGFF